MNDMSCSLDYIKYDYILKALESAESAFIELSNYAILTEGVTGDLADTMHKAIKLLKTSESN